MTNTPAIVQPAALLVANTNAVNGIISNGIAFIPVRLNPTITVSHVLVVPNINQGQSPWVLDVTFCHYYFVEATNLGLGNFGIAVNSTPYMQWSLPDNESAGGFPIGDQGNFNWSDYQGNVFRALFTNEHAFFCAYGTGAGIWATNAVINVDTNNVLVTNNIVTLTSNGVYTIDEQMFSDVLGYYLQPLSYYFTNSTGVTNWVAPDGGAYKLFYNPYLTTNITTQ